MSAMRVAVIGAGSISREFATRHFGPSTRTVVACIVDVDEDRARSLAADVGSVQAGAAVVGANKYQSRASEVLGRPVPYFTELNQHALSICDCVYVGTPPRSHAPIVLTSLEAGKHVILEKPIAASGEDADLIVNAAEEALQKHGLHTSLDIGMRWNDALVKMRQELQQGRLGALKEGWLRLHFRTWPRDWQVQPWCAVRFEGGPLREVGTHFLFGIHELFGHGCVRRVCAEVSYSDGPTGTCAEAAADGILELEGGIFGAAGPTPIHLSVRTQGQTELVASGCDLYELEVRCAEGGLCLHDFASLRDAQGRAIVRNASYGRCECVDEVVAAAATVGSTSNARASTGTMVTAREARNAQRVLDAIFASSGEWVEVSYA